MTRGISKRGADRGGVVLLIFAVIVVGTIPLLSTPALPQCSDGIDNLDGPPDINGDPTGDGFIDASPVSLQPAVLPPYDLQCHHQDPINGLWSACPLWNSESISPNTASECALGY